MKNDQQEIRERVRIIYNELGQSDAAANGALMTAVTSYGEKFAIHTPQPTSDVHQIRAAIASIPNDPSGKEMMCQAVQAAIARHHPYAKKTERRMALILVTDESGNPENNRQFLEQTIGLARKAGCRIYVLGREAAFGRQVAHVRWVHPQTNKEHWLPIDRGPETAFPEQLKTDGRRLRSESHASGFGSYEQTRLARYTGGIFFMLPSVEIDLIQDRKAHKYQLSVMRKYHPDLRSRGEISNPNNKHPLRWAVTNIVIRFDPSKEDIAKTIQVRRKYSPAKFQKELAAELQRARFYRYNLQQGIETLKKNRVFREQETSPRWQANYDMMLAQLNAYRARTNELVSYLEQLGGLQPHVEEKAGYNFTGWQLVDTKRVVGEITPDLIQQSSAMFQQVIQDNAHTPWATRSEWELERTFGVELVAQYKRKPKPKPKPKPSTNVSKPKPKPVAKPKPKPRPKPKPKPVGPPPIPIPNL